MKNIIVKIMTEVLGIFAIMTKEIKQGRTSESIPDDRFPVADGDSEKYVKKYLKKLIGRKDIEDALNRLDRLTQEEVNMAAVQILKVAHHIKGGVEAVGVDVKGVGVEVKGVSDNVNQLIEGTFSNVSYSQIPSQTKNTTRWQENESSYGRREALVVPWSHFLLPRTEVLALHTGRQMIEESRSRVRADRAWLSAPDASTNHNFASRAQQKGTATWFFKGDLSKEWKSKSTTSLLWIHGKRVSFCSFVFAQY